MSTSLRCTGECTGSYQEEGELCPLHSAAEDMACLLQKMCDEIDEKVLYVGYQDEQEIRRLLKEVRA